MWRKYGFVIAADKEALLGEVNYTLLTISTICNLKTRALSTF
jgi:hypothetical protein